MKAQRLFALLIACITFVAHADIVWSGAAGNGRWDDPGNWQGNAVPSLTSDVQFPAGKDGTIILSPTYHECHVFKVNGQYAFSMDEADGPWTFTIGNTVTAELDAEKVRPVIEAFGAAMGREVGSSSKAGLYYSLLRGTALDAIDEVRACKLATGETISFEDTGDAPDAAFYRVKATFDFQSAQ